MAELYAKDYAQTIMLGENTGLLDRMHAGLNPEILGKLTVGSFHDWDAAEKMLTEVEKSIKREKMAGVQTTAEVHSVGLTAEQVNVIQQANNAKNQRDSHQHNSFNQQRQYNDRYQESRWTQQPPQRGYQQQGYQRQEQNGHRPPFGACYYCNSNSPDHWLYDCAKKRDDNRQNRP
jgi:hypothetical protein